MAATPAAGLYFVCALPRCGSLRDPDPERGKTLYVQTGTGRKPQVRPASPAEIEKALRDFPHIQAMLDIITKEYPK